MTPEPGRAQPSSQAPNPPLELLAALGTLLTHALLTATERASLLLLFGTVTGAADVEAHDSYREAQVTGTAEGFTVRPGTKLMNPGSAEVARLNAGTNFIAFGLALLTLSIEAFAAWRAGAQARTLRTHERLRMYHGTEQAAWNLIHKV